MREWIERYGWADRDQDLAWTVAVVVGRSRADVLRAYGGDPGASLGKLTYRAANRRRMVHFDEYAVVQLLIRGDEVVAIEPNGWTGSVPEVARSVSASGRFFSVYWSVNDIHRVVEAADGELHADFELRAGARPYSPGDTVPAWLPGLELSLHELRAASLALLEIRTGVAFDPQWLELRLPTYRIPDRVPQAAAP